MFNRRRSIVMCGITLEDATGLTSDARGPFTLLVYRFSAILLPYREWLYLDALVTGSEIKPFEKETVYDSRCWNKRRAFNAC